MNLTEIFIKWAKNLKAEHKDCFREFETDLTDFTTAHQSAETLGLIFKCDNYTDLDKETLDLITNEYNELNSKANDQKPDELTLDDFKEPDVWENIRYIAFYGFVIFHRRRLDYQDIENCISAYSSHFSGFSSYPHLQIMHEIDKPNHEDITNDEIEKGLTLAYTNIKEYTKLNGAEKFINVAGVNHAFADLFATYCEHYTSFKDNLMASWYDKAESAIYIAKEEKKVYAKYYCTHGRILAQKGLYKEALRQIDKAIDEENSNLNDAEYALRIIQYQSYRSQIQARAELDKMEIKQNEIDKEFGNVKDSLVSNVEIIGFFSGIISFIIASINLFESMSAVEACVLMVILLGALLTAFGGFSLLLSAGKNKKFKIIVISIGIGLILLGGVTIFCFAILTALLPPV